MYVNYDVSVLRVFNWLRTAESLGIGNKPSGSVNGGEILDQVFDYQLLENYLWS
jgi:hypothetical protein